jgi:hypothetical protein
MDYRDGKRAKKILELQQNNGSWGYFHSLSNPTPKQPMTTEQALRRLEILGFTINDNPIQKADRIKDCTFTINKIIKKLY